MLRTSRRFLGTFWQFFFKSCFPKELLHVLPAQMTFIHISRPTTGRDYVHYYCSCSRHIHYSTTTRRSRNLYVHVHNVYVRIRYCDLKYSAVAVMLHKIYLRTSFGLYNYFTDTVYTFKRLDVKASVPYAHRCFPLRRRDLWKKNRVSLKSLVLIEDVDLPSVRGFRKNNTFAREKLCLTVVCNSGLKSYAVRH